MVLILCRTVASQGGLFPPFEITTTGASTEPSKPTGFTTVPPPPPQTTRPPPPPPATTTSNPTTTNPPPPPPPPSSASSNLPSTTVRPPPATTTAPTTTNPRPSTNPTTRSTTPTTTSKDSSDATTDSASLTGSSTSAYPTSNPTFTPPPTDNSEKATIIGAVVGGVVGVALIGGALAYVNRRGGCTSRTDKKQADFEDFGLAERDFPQQPAPQAHRPAAAVNPTIPRLNEQGTFYNEPPLPPLPPAGPAEYNHGSHTYVAGYTPQQQPMTQVHQDYYYDSYAPQEGAYYDAGGNHYYYDNSTTTTAVSPGYEHAPAGVQQPQGFSQAGGPTDYYKPDTADVMHQRR
ncbi:hypothetical protein EC973_008541 [Apophysomyces ossiformis]|uniref:Uncharacterized protein n=1 Tax=Apophysomyces ossiformis TaxID=679940 RepID=A0A8H7EQ82_9FUNG|nr:hypothetical protein EC973_008541 [Apophysomyces ossiformis]